MKQNDNGKTKKILSERATCDTGTYNVHIEYEIRNTKPPECHVLSFLLLLLVMHSEFWIINYVNIEHLYFSIFLFSFWKIERKKLIHCKDLRPHKNQMKEILNCSVNHMVLFSCIEHCCTLYIDQNGGRTEMQNIFYKRKLNGFSNEQLAIMFNSHVLVNKLPQSVYAHCTLSIFYFVLCVPCMMYGCAKDNYSRSITISRKQLNYFIMFEVTITACI